MDWSTEDTFALESELDSRAQRKRNSGDMRLSSSSGSLSSLAERDVIGQTRSVIISNPRGAPETRPAARQDPKNLSSRSYIPHRIKRKLSSRRAATGSSFTYTLRPSRAFSTEIAASALKNLSKGEQSRQELIFQFCTEEPLYLADLLLLQETYAEPLLKKRLLTQEEYSDLFGILPRLVLKTEALVVSLNGLVDQIPIKRFSNSFLYHIRELQPVLTEYVGRRSILLALLSGIEEQNSIAAGFIESCQSQPAMRGMTLENLISVPAFRFEAYLGFARQLMELTNALHPDREDLGAALVCLNNIQQLAEVKDRENQKLIRVSHLQSALDRRYSGLFDIYNLEMEAEAVVTAPRFQSPDAHLILLSKMLLVVKKTSGRKKSTMVVTRKIDLLHMEISAYKNHGETPNTLLLKIFHETWSFEFKTLALRKQFEGLVANLNQREVEDASRRIHFDPVVMSPPPPPPRRKALDDTEKIKTLLVENSHLAQQLAKISHSAHGVAPRASAAQKNIFIFYGPRSSGKTALAKYFVQHCDLKARCAYLPEEILHLTSLDPTQRKGLAEKDDGLLKVDQAFGLSMLEAVLATETPQYDFVVVDGRFEDRAFLKSLLQALEAVGVPVTVVCCYAPYSLRRERAQNDDEPLPQCQPFEMPGKGSVFIDTSKPVPDIFASQLTPILRAIGISSSQGAHRE